MAASVVEEQQGRKREVGRILTPILITNRADEIRAEDGSLPPERIRRVALDEVLVDTGATTIALPKSIIDRLGLEVAREVPVKTASGHMVTRLYNDARLTIMGRTSVFDCLELPDGTTPLLGVIPLESLGIELDLQNQRLVLLPEDGPNTHFLLY